MAETEEKFPFVHILAMRKVFTKFSFPLYVTDSAIYEFGRLFIQPDTSISYILKIN